MTREILLFFFLLFCGQRIIAQFNYPATKTVDSSNTWHNVTVKDPYRWLEDLKSPETANWLKAQANFTDSILNKLPNTDLLISELTKLDVAQPEQKFGVIRIGNSIFYNQLKSGENKLKIYRQFDNSSTPQVIASPEMWGTRYNIHNWDVDPSEKFIAIYALEGGKEINEVKIYSIAENKILPDKITGSYKGFMKNQNGVFYYTQRPTYDPHEIYSHNDEIFKTHIIGTDTLLDKIIVSKATNPEIMSYADQRYLWEIQTFKGCNYEFTCISPSEFLYRKSPSVDKWQRLFDADENVYNIIFYYNNKIYYTSFKDAPNGKIKMLDLNNLSAKPKTILAEQADPVYYQGIAQTKNYLIVPLIKNGITTYSKFIYLPTHKITASPFKESNAITRYYGNPAKNDSIKIVRESWINFPQVTTAAIGSNKETPSKYVNFRSLPFVNNLIVEEIEVPGYDGTLVPLSIIRRKDLKFNGNNIALLYGYGAYGDTWAPLFDQTSALLANKGVVVCIAHVRGGGEKGDNWHKAGTKQSKPNTWKDFNSCAEYLINNGYTASTHLACTGGSAGGILIGRAITERPDLWACAIPESAVLNILRFEYSTGGKTQVADFGTVDDINDFFSMMESDGLMHIQKGTNYPAMLVITGWDDQRVNCWQGAKFAAAAQNATTSGKPVLLKVNFSGGHNGDAISKQAAIKEQAVKYAFMLWQCGFDKANKYESLASSD